MSSSLTLHQVPGNPRGNGPRIVADLANVKINFEWHEQYHPEVVKIHALGKIPVLETPQGPLFEQHAILRYLARLSTGRKYLLGKTPYEEALVNQWLDFINLEIIPDWDKVVKLVWRHRPLDEKNLAAYVEAKSALIAKLRIVEDYLKNNTYLAGHQITIADVALYTWLSNLFSFTIDENSRKGLTNIIRWFVHIGHYDEVVRYYRKPFFAHSDWFADLIQKSGDKKKPAQGEATAAPKKGGNNKKPEEKKKEEPKAKPAKQTNEEEEDEPPKPKAKKIYDTLPPTTFNLFDFKTLYVNAENKHEALDFFWKNYDPTGYSLWYCKYIKYPGEGVKLHLTYNLLEGTLQRLDEFRKYAFAVQGIYGEEGNYEIRGVWIWRGTDIAPDIKDLPNFEYHTWDRLDEKNEAHRKLLTEYWTGFKIGESVADGLVARDVTYYK